ncbi:hypothetical protein [Cupriavidus campinensis]
MDKFAKTTLAVLGSLVFLSGSAFAQKNYTDGGDLYGGSHSATKPKSGDNPSKAGKFDPYTDGARAATGAKLTHTPQTPDEEQPARNGAAGANNRTGPFDPNTEGARTNQK